MIVLLEAIISAIQSDSNDNIRMKLEIILRLERELLLFFLLCGLLTNDNILQRCRM